MDASNGWSVQLGYVLDPETAPTWPDMSLICFQYGTDIKRAIDGNCYKL